MSDCQKKEWWQEWQKYIAAIIEYQKERADVFEKSKDTICPELCCRKNKIIKPDKK